MAEQSGFWTTSATPIGDQQASYSQADFTDAYRILAACAGFEGVAPGYLNELACTASGANTVAVNTGGAMVDGKWFYNDASQDVNIPSASGAGNTRIDRIVLRATWAGFNVSVTRIAGTDAATPSAPAITQTSETTYDIMLCQALVDTSGVVVVTDERTFAVTDRYDVYVMIAADDDTALSVENGLITLPVADIHDGKLVVKLSARVATASSSGDVSIRIYNVTDTATIGTVTITAGSTTGSTTTIAAPILATNDILRIDVTGAGTGTAGLAVTIKVDKI